MSLLLEVTVRSEHLEEALDTLAALPFAIDPSIRALGQKSMIEFPVRESFAAGLVQNSLLARGLGQAHVTVHSGI